MGKKGPTQELLELLLKVNKERRAADEERASLAENQRKSMRVNEKTRARSAVEVESDGS